MENKQEWLDSLQVGDQVAMNAGSYGYSLYLIETVKKITPTRRISTSNGKTFNSNGTEYGKRDAWKPTVRIQPVTEEIRDSIERRHLMKVLNLAKFEELTTEQLRAIYSIIKEESAS